MFNTILSQKGRYIDTVTSVIDLEHLSFQKHYYWPGINLFREVHTVSIMMCNYHVCVLAQQG